ncbi:hypothetical protein HMPREF3104_02775 [Corynebacterium sp. HMSC30G07]|uniref:DUF6270 domain-containing protein n=1 Tax=Corynebacterium sp. HMSC30G07 TaxID=1581072 RepID=UPI0008A0FAC5|nr:DUF6270 domain-containing protein [Corynebacterium sp. HMSC30G07]OFT77186.1 hypothetical protein HMPREF3104_02775 [Corynebacterium sp. HMSC30G07]
MRKVFIYGSCVTRDSVDFWDEHNLELHGYVARQSLISATSSVNSTVGFNLNGVTSSFQRRMIKNDLLGTAIKQVKEAIDDGAVVVWDLTDERNGVLALEDGRIVSAVAERTSGLVRTAQIQETIRFTDDKFLPLWRQALGHFKRSLGTRIEKITINATPWATSFPDGQPIRESFPTSNQFNSALNIMTNYAKELGFQTFEVPKEIVFGSTDHKWGPAPFHYSDNAYVAMAEKIGRFALMNG